jgi:hypothetical protein
MTITAFDIEVETVWKRLKKLGPGASQVVCISPRTGLLWLRRLRFKPYPNEVGTYDHTITLAAFSEDCHHARGRA